MRILNNKDIYTVVNRYIGVHGGYLGDFSYRTHSEFYLEFCDLDINPYEYEGTTRERFIQILGGSSSGVQAKILEGILEKYPVGSDEIRTQERYDQIKAMIAKCRGAAAVGSPKLVITSEVVSRAISDAETLIATSGATSGVDRVHTALHGYIKAACEKAGIQYGKDASINQLFMLLKQGHPAFQQLGIHQGSIVQALRSLGAILDAFNPVRNRGSVAHPNEDLLGQDEAMLFINSARTILQYLDSKVARHK